VFSDLQRGYHVLHGVFHPETARYAIQFIRLYYGNLEYYRKSGSHRSSDGEVVRVFDSHFNVPGSIPGLVIGIFLNDFTI
jgi:hypothetical protein